MKEVLETQTVKSLDEGQLFDLMRSDAYVIMRNTYKEMKEELMKSLLFTSNWDDTLIIRGKCLMLDVLEKRVVGEYNLKKTTTH